MNSYNELITLIDAVINRNGVQAITGMVLNGVLKAMVQQLGAGYSLSGVAHPTDDPGTPDQPVCYYASEVGTYTNFGGVSIVAGELALLCYDMTDGWFKETMYEGFRQVTAQADDNIGVPSVDVSYSNGVLDFRFRNIKGEPGENGQDGQDGQDGAAAGFGTISASVDANVGTPSVAVTESGPDTAKNLAFAFHNLKGADGDPGVTSVNVTVDNTSGSPACAVSLNAGVLTLAFTGLKGAQGDTGSSVAYPFTIVNNLTTDDATQALSAAQGVVLEGEISQLEHELSDTFSGNIGFSLSNANPDPSDFPEYVDQKGRLTLLNAQDSYLWACLTSRYFGIESGGVDIPMTFVAQVGDLFCYVSDEVIKAGTMVAIIKIRELAKSQDERLTITATSYTVNYGDAMPTFSWSANGAVSGEPEITCVASAGSPAGEYSILISRGTITDDNAIYMNGVLTIEKAELTVTADNKQVAIGGTMPSFTVQYSGFVLGEDETALTTAPTCTTDAEDTDTEGFFTITPQGGLASNYSFIYVSGILQVGDPVTLSWTSAQVYAAQSTKAFIDVSANVWKTSNTYTGVLIKCDFWQGKKVQFTRSADWTGVRYAFLRSFRGTSITNNMTIDFSQQSGYTAQITNTTDTVFEEIVPSDAVYMYVYAKSSSINVAPSIDWKGASPTVQYRNLEASLFTANKTIGADGAVYTGSEAAPAHCCTTSRLDVSTFANLFKFGQIVNAVPAIYEFMVVNIAEYTATGSFLRRQSYERIPYTFELSPATASFHIIVVGQTNGVDVPISSVPFDGNDIQAIGTA